VGQMTNRPTLKGGRPGHALAVRLDRALTLLDRIVSIIEAGSPRTADPTIWNDMKSRAKGWKDPEVRAAIISLYGRASTRDAQHLLAAEFGSSRVPCKSALSRIFIQMARHEIASQLNENEAS